MTRRLALALSSNNRKLPTTAKKKRKSQRAQNLAMPSRSKKPTISRTLSPNLD